MIDDVLRAMTHKDVSLPNIPPPNVPPYHQNSSPELGSILPNDVELFPVPEVPVYPQYLKPQAPWRYSNGDVVHVGDILRYRGSIGMVTFLSPYAEEEKQWVMAIDGSDIYLYLSAVLGKYKAFKVERGLYELAFIPYLDKSGLLRHW